MVTSHPSLGFLIADTARLMRRRFEQRSHSTGFTRAQWHVLACLAAHEGIQQNRLAELVEIKPITLARLIDRMEEQDLVERRPHPTDRRAHLLYLSPTAGPAIAAMEDIARQTRDEALAGLSDEGYGWLVAGLTLIKTNLATACRHPAEAEPAPLDEDLDRD